MAWKGWKVLRRRGLIRWLPVVIGLWIRLLARTLRFRIAVSQETARLIREGRPMLLVFWHGRMLIMPEVFHRVCGRDREGWTLVSEHWDGELIARAVARFGIQSIRGSSTKGGDRAFRQLIQKLRHGCMVGITPDGPSGPRYRIQRGVLKLSQLTGAAIVPVAWAARPRVVARSWDHFQVPVPFARVSLVFAGPTYVPRRADPEEVEALRVELEQGLRQLTERTERDVLRTRWSRGGIGSGPGTRLKAAFQRFWDEPSKQGLCGTVVFAGLIVPSFLYGLAQRVRRRLYRKGILRQRRVISPVVSVGGLRVGGSGKTPFTMWVARRLSEFGCRVVILTRGYGRAKRTGTIWLTREGLDRWSPSECGDEPYLMARSLPGIPVAVDSDRYRAARLAEERFSPDLFLLDDGFQHLRLARDLDIVLVPEGDGTRREACLPRGPLREPSSALREADLVVQVRGGWEVPEHPRHHGDSRNGPAGTQGTVHRARLVAKGLFRVEDGSPVDPGELGGARGLAFCGIARPASFWGTLDGLGLRIEQRRAYPDHYRYSSRDIEEILGLLSFLDFGVTTEKDAIKIDRYGWPRGRMFFVRLDLILDDEQAFWQCLGRSVRIPGGGGQ